MRPPEPADEGPGRHALMGRSQLLLTLPRGGGFARDLMGQRASSRVDREGNPTPSSGSGDSLAPRFSSAVRDDVSDAVYTNTGVMGLVRAPTRMYLVPQAGTPGPSLAGPSAGRTSWLFDSLDRPDGPNANRNNRGVRGEPDRMPEPSLALEALALYLPELVLRQFAHGKVRPLPHAERLRGALLFADITGFTQLTQQLQASELGPARGAEELNKILSDYFDLLIRCFHAHGGDVVSFSGDAMTVLFEAVEGETAARLEAAAEVDVAAARGSKASSTDGDVGAGGPVAAVAVCCGHTLHGSTSSAPLGLLEHPAVIVKESSVRESTVSREPSTCSVRISVEKSNSPSVTGRLSVEARLPLENSRLSVAKSNSPAARSSVESARLPVEHSRLSVGTSSHLAETGNSSQSSSARAGSPGHGTSSNLGSSTIRSSSASRLARATGRGSTGGGSAGGSARRSTESVDTGTLAEGACASPAGSSPAAASARTLATPPTLPSSLAHASDSSGAEGHDNPFAGLVSLFGFWGSRRPSPQPTPGDTPSPSDNAAPLNDPGSTVPSASLRSPTPAKNSRPSSPRRSSLSSRPALSISAPLSPGLPPSGAAASGASSGAAPAPMTLTPAAIVLPPAAIGVTSAAIGAPSDDSLASGGGEGGSGSAPRWSPAAVSGGDPKRAALVRASLRAAQCALDVLEKVNGFSLARYTQYGVAEISLHASMGAGELVGIHVSGEPTDPPSTASSPHEGSVSLPGSSGDSVPNTPGSFRADRPRARNSERRDGFALMGSPMRQLREAERRAKKRECVVSPEVWALLAPHAEATVDADGFAKLRSLRKAGHNRAWREADRERAATLGRQREAALFFVERSVDAATRLAAYVPEPVQYRLRTAGMNWLADFRLASILFVRVLTLSHEGKDDNVASMVAKTQQVFGAIRAEISRFEGMLARFNVDDKGTILFAAFGPPPYQHEDDAVRAVLCALQVSAVMGGMGHVVRVGVTTGTVFAGSVGNAERGEYTFYGETVNMAARLMTSESNTSVLVDEHTMRDSAHEVRFESLPPLRVKGWAQPVASFKPTERRGLLGGAPRGRGAAAQTRQDERARLHLMLSALARDERGGLLMVQGEAGMGKTSLLREAERMAVGLNTTVLKGSCSAIDEGTPLHVFGFVMRQLLDGLSIGHTLGGSRRGLAQSLATADTSRRNRRPDEALRLPEETQVSPAKGARMPTGPPSGISGRRSTGPARAEMLATLGTASEGRALSVRSLLDNGSAEFWRHVPLLSGLLGLGIGDTPYTANLRGEKRRDKLLALCVQLLRAKAAQHHTLVLLDNVQWMDAKSWELLLKVKHELPNVLVICAMRTPPVGNSSSAPNLLPEQAAVPVAAVRRRPSRGQSRVAAPSAAAIGASPLVRSKNMADRSSSTAQMDSSLGPGEGSPTQRSSAASPTFKRSLTSRAWIPAESETPRPPSKARSSSPPHRPRSTSPPARLAEAVAALSAAATGMAANLLSTRPSELPSDTAGGPAESSEPAAESLRERQPLKMFAAVPGRSSSPVEVPRGGSPGPAGRTLLLSTADRKLKTSQMAVLTTLEEEERMRLGPLQEADLAFMALEMLGVETLPDELASFLLRKSEGNPLYCHEIMSFLLRQRLLLPATIVDGQPTPLPQSAEPMQEGGYDMNDGADLKPAFGLAASALGAAGQHVQTVLLSPGASLSSLESAFAAEGSVAGNSHALQRLLTAQVDALPHEQQAVLKTASAMGDALTSKSLRDVHAALSIQPTGSRLDDALRRLRHGRILEFALDTKTYSFRSAMLRDVVYSNLTYEQRQRLHQATATALVAESEKGDGHATAHLSALKHYKAAENWTQVMLLAADAARQALGCASWEEAVSVTTFAALVHRQHGQGVALPPGATTHWLVLRGEALLALGQRAEANVALGLAFDDGISRGSNVTRRAPIVKGTSVPRRLSAVFSLFRRPTDRRGSVEATPPEPKRRHTEGGSAPQRPPSSSRGAESVSMGEARSGRRSSDELGSGGCSLTCAEEVQHALRAFAMLFFGQLETAAESDGDAAAAIVNATPIASRLPLALAAATLLPEGPERMLGFACALIAAGLSARQATPAPAGGRSGPLSRSKLSALHDAIEYFVEMSPVATKLSRSLGEALSPPAPSSGGPSLLISRTMETSSIEMCSPSFLAMLCLALGLSPISAEPTAALWFRRASALALEAEHGQLHRTICMLSVDAPLSATL